MAKSVRGCASVLTVALVAYLGSTASSAHAQTRGVLIAPPELQDAWLADARRRAPGEWAALEALESEPAVPERSVTEAYEAYASADFEGCVSALAWSEATIAEQLAARHRVAVANALMLRAACANLLEQTDVAQDALLRARVAGLTIEDATVELAHTHERELSRELPAVGTATLDIQVEPRRATIEVDGQATPCGSGPCELPLPIGPHVVRAVADGYEPAIVLVSLRAARSVEVELRAEGADATRDRLRRRLSQARPELRSEVLARWAQTFEAELLLAERGGRVALFDAATTARFGPVSSQDGAVDALFDRRQGTPLMEEPLFWVLLTLGVIAVGAAVAIPLGVYFTPRALDFRR